MSIKEDTSFAALNQKIHQSNGNAKENEDSGGNSQEFGIDIEEFLN